MVIRYRPDIAPEHYGAFRNLLKDQIPATFNDWDREREKEVQQLTPSGHNVIPVKIDPDEFATYCRAHNASPSVHLLDTIAYEKGGRHQD
ncbi:MAG: hypothetical protein ACREFP_17515 [Acetobacteraceae bacterium]